MQKWDHSLLNGPGKNKKKCLKLRAKAEKKPHGWKQFLAASFSAPAKTFQDGIGACVWSSASNLVQTSLGFSFFFFFSLHNALIRILNAYACGITTCHHYLQAPPQAEELESYFNFSFGRRNKNNRSWIQFPSQSSPVGCSGPTQPAHSKPHFSFPCFLSLFSFLFPLYCIPTDFSMTIMLS